MDLSRDYMVIKFLGIMLFPRDYIRMIDICKWDYLLGMAE